MSDTTAYVNSYIDNAVMMIHENTATILQLKTQLKLANSLLSQKDAAIGNLSSKVEELSLSSNDLIKLKDDQINSNSSELAKLREDVKTLTDKNHALSNKVSHMDALLNQINEMKITIQQKDNDIVSKDSDIVTLNDKIKSLTQRVDELLLQIEKLNIPAKEPEVVINTKSKSSAKNNTTTLPFKKIETDDF